MNRDDRDPSTEDMERLAPIVERLYGEQFHKERQTKDPAELRRIRLEYHKEIMRTLFLANDLASSADFERLWPRLLDDYLIEDAKTLYFQVHDYLDALRSADDEFEE